MDKLNFSDLKYLITVVTDDLLHDDFSHFQDRDSLGSEYLSDVSEEMYDKVHALNCLLSELYKHRPLLF